MNSTLMEICAGGGGQAVGLEAAGLRSLAAIDNDPAACATLRLNRPDWNIIEADLREIDGKDYRGVDVLAGGVPCPPFSIAGKQLGEEDERDLFPEALRLVREAQPRAVLFENVRGLATPKFGEYRRNLQADLLALGYEPEWRLLSAADYGVPQQRPRFVLVALLSKYKAKFEWPEPFQDQVTVGSALFDLMNSNGWSGASAWRERAQTVGPTIVGGSKKHGGPDLGPTRAREAWLKLGVDGRGIADLSPDQDFPEDGSPKLTLRMVARLQGFPDSWVISGKKTAAYRQLGNAFPPPVAYSVGVALAAALDGNGKSPNQGALLMERSAAYG
jgi:DNA (cytosine-5)-methyltransferase 1